MAGDNKDGWDRGLAEGRMGREGGTGNPWARAEGRRQYEAAHPPLQGGDPLTGLLWLIFVLPFKILFWLVASGSGRTVLIVVVGLVSLGGLSIYLQEREAAARHDALARLGDADFSQTVKLTVKANNGPILSVEVGELVSVQCTVELAPHGDDYFTRFASDCSGLERSDSLTYLQNLGLNYLRRRNFVNGFDGEVLTWKRLGDGGELDFFPVVNFEIGEDGTLVADRGREERLDEIAQARYPGRIEKWELKFIE